MQSSLRSSIRTGCATRKALMAVPGTRGMSVQRSRSSAVQVKALFSPPSDDKKDNKKFITREEEPEEYWSSKSEKAGANPFKDPIAIVGIVAIFFPFIFLLIAIGTGVVDISVYR